MNPFVKLTDVQGMMEDPDQIITRRISDMASAYADEEAARKMAEEANPVVYEMYEAHVPTVQGELAFCTTKMYPGKVGQEYFMTKGHYHVDEQTAEIYYAYSGHGVLLTQTKDGEYCLIDMPKGAIAHVEPGWAHRTYNVGDEPFVFLAVYPVTAGHDYGSIEKEGFSHTLVKGNSGPELIENPKRKQIMIGKD